MDSRFERTRKGLSSSLALPLSVDLSVSLVTTIPEPPTWSGMVTIAMCRWQVWPCCSVWGIRGWWLWSLKRGRGQVVLNSAGGAGAATVVAVAMDGWVLRMYGGGLWRRLFFMTMIQDDQGGARWCRTLVAFSWFVRGRPADDGRKSCETFISYSLYK
jgi:hypothetical protein